VSADLNSVLGLGERFSGKVLASDAELYNARLARLPVGRDGLTLGAAVSHNTWRAGIPSGLWMRLAVLPPPS
jgi:hemolysin activation/secretion protein